MLKEMPKNTGGGDGSNQHKGATGTKTEPVAKIEPPATKNPTYAELNIDKKDASK